MMTIAAIVYYYCGKKPSHSAKKPSRGGKKPSRDDEKFPAEYLNEKLQNFREENPGLFDRMVNLLEALDRAATAQ